MGSNTSLSKIVHSTDFNNRQVESQLLIRELCLWILPELSHIVCDFWLSGVSFLLCNPLDVNSAITLSHNNSRIWVNNPQKAVRLRLSQPITLTTPIQLSIRTIYEWGLNNETAVNLEFGTRKFVVQHDANYYENERGHVLLRQIYISLSVMDSAESRLFIWSSNVNSMYPLHCHSWIVPGHSVNLVLYFPTKCRYSSVSIAESNKHPF
jgi:hypothetical protein